MAEPGLPESRRRRSRPRCRRRRQNADIKIEAVAKIARKKILSFSIPLVQQRLFRNSAGDM